MAWISRKKLLLPLLAAAAGGPFLALDDGWKPAWLAKATQSAMAWSQSGSAASLPVVSLPGDYAQGSAVAEGAPPAGHGVGAPQAQVQNHPHGNFGHYFRFDLSPNQVFSTWDRVTTVLSDSNLEGLRVALVTGARVDDVAGSLTYYFDKQHYVQRVTFHGTTGDPRRLIQFIQETYKFQQQPTLDAALYVAQWNGQPTSALRVLHAPVVKSSEAHSRYHVQLEINRPYVPYQFKLTPPNEQQLLDAHRANRW